MKQFLLSFILLLTPCLGDVKSTTGEIEFKTQLNGEADMTLNTIGLGIGTTPSANLHVDGNAIISKDLFIGSGNGSSNLNINGSIGYSFEVLSSNTTIDDGSVFFADTSSDNITITLPYAGNVSGREIQIKKISASNNVVIQGGGAIDNAHQFILSSGQLGTCRLMSRGSQHWNILWISGNASPVEYEYDTSTGSDGTGGFVRNNGSNYESSTITVKNAGSGSSFTRKGYVRLDLSELNVTATEAEFNLTLDSYNGGSSHTVYVYGLMDESLDDWDSATMTYNNAPANDLSSGQAPDTASGKTSLLGSFVVSSGEGNGTLKSVSGANVVNFINSDTNGKVTFIVGRSSVDSATNLDFQASGNLPRVIVTP